MGEVLRFLVGLDHDAMRASTELRWSPATGAFVVLSAWWVKGPLLVAAGWLADIRARRALPLVALATAASFVLASALSATLKDVFDRARPPAAIDVDPLVAVPGSASFPSGHALTAFAAATAIAVLVPRARAVVLVLAAAIALSRVYLGVHFWVDVLAGAALGALVGLAVATPVARRLNGYPPPVR